MDILQLSLFSDEKLGFRDPLTVDVHKKIEYTKKLKVVSLFSGCGGMDLGFRGNFDILGKHYDENPIDIVFANDIMPRACKTYEHIFKHKPICDDIKSIPTEDIPKVDIVIGGFPCQDFSHAGKRKGLNSERGQLYLEMKRVIEHCNPLAFVAENVDGIRTSTNGTSVSALDTILKDFENSGYNIKYKALNTADYGVPQTRIRIIIIGIRKDIDFPILFPKAVYGNSTGRPWITVREAIDDLWDKLDSNFIANHSHKDYSRAKFYPNRKMQGNRKLDEDKPSITIRSEHHGNIEGHYRSTNMDNPEDMSFWRRLSVRECARIQTFPDDFEFPCAASDAYKQIGNAVPPVFAWHIARALFLSLKNKQD